MTFIEQDMRAERLGGLPRYLFEHLAETRRRKEAEGSEVIDLSIGDPEMGAPETVVEALKVHAGDRRLHRYTPHDVVMQFNRAVSKWMAGRFGVMLDPETEILPLIGTKEGIANLPLAVLNPGEVALVPDPGYPVYSRGVWFAGGKVEWMPLEEASGFLGDTGRILDLCPRMVYANYPNNPTSAVAGPEYFAGLIDAARKAGSIAVNDAAYSETVFDGYRSDSMLAVPGAMDMAVEFHSFSKTFSMAGWRVGFVAGARSVVQALRTYKSNIDSGVFGPVLLAAVEALESGWDWCRKTLEVYAGRRRILLDALDKAGIGYHHSPATLYIWARVPSHMGSIDFARALLEKSGILVAPGIGFGDCGEGYFRLSITCPTARVEEAGRRLSEAGDKWTA
jgi:LL-diaminopimelate aminotransferase